MGRDDEGMWKQTMGLVRPSPHPHPSLSCPGRSVALAFPALYKTGTAETVPAGGLASPHCVLSNVPHPHPPTRARKLPPGVMHGKTQTPKKFSWRRADLREVLTPFPDTLCPFPNSPPPRAVGPRLGWD